MTSASRILWSRFRFRWEAIFRLSLALFGLSPPRKATLSKVLTAAWCVTICFGLATGSRDHSLRQIRSCKRASDCNVELGEICYKPYEGCFQRQCMCMPGHQADHTGRCRKVRRGRDSCEMGLAGQCPDGMTCHYGRCECVAGDMTLDRDYCLRANERLLGQSCSRSEDKCVQKSASGYIREEVVCSERGVCQCAAGLKAEGNSCQRHSIGEYGCVENYHCDGGSLCMNNVCRCPSGRMPMAGNTKCGRTGALQGLSVGEVCDEIGEQSYCDSGLVCHPCGYTGRNICVRSQVTPYPSHIVSPLGAPPLNPSLTCLLVAILAYIMLMR